ncbi:MAG: hypothetical protein KGZ69_12775 [Methylomonas sp.]|nr:hypothetical protein [Methylomonas sp.]
MSQLPFLVDQRAKFKGRAVTHALLIGVSHYDHASSLDAGAHTAVRIYEWLKSADEAGALPAPLATATLLLSPTNSERTIVEEQIGKTGWAPATGSNILDAQERLFQLTLEMEADLKKPDLEIGAGLAFYYFGGHGADFFRDDPIGFASDFDDAKLPWAGAFDHLEFRERLTRIDDERSVAASERARCLIFYDCCRTRDDEASFGSAIHLNYKPVLDQPAGVRPFHVLSAATESFAAWEPSESINLPPHYDLPLSFFGHALLNAIQWSQDYSSNSQFPWHTSATGLLEDVARAMKELAKHDSLGEPLPGAPSLKLGPPDFPVVRSKLPPKVTVSLSCDPENGRHSKTIEIDERAGIAYQRRHTLPPWTGHPDSLTCVPGLFRIEARCPKGSLQKDITLRPALTVWEWIVRDDDITVHDPAD